MRKVSLALTLIFVFIFTFTSMSPSVFAEDKTEKSYLSLEELAKDYLVKVTRIDKDGVTTITVRHIPQFTEAAHKYFPELDDIVIARFIYKYTGKEEKPESLPDEVVLEILESEETGVQTETLSPEKEETKGVSQRVKVALGITVGILIVAGAVVVVIMKNKKGK